MWGVKMSRNLDNNSADGWQDITISSLVGTGNNIVPESNTIFTKKITSDTISFLDFYRDENVTFNNTKINTTDPSFRDSPINEQQQKLSTALGILPEDESYFLAFLVKYNQQLAKLYVNELNAKLATGDVGYQLNAQSSATAISYDPTTHQLKLVQIFTGPFENQAFNGVAEPITTTHDGQIEQSFTFDKETELFKAHIKAKGDVAKLYANKAIAPEKFEIGLILLEKLPYLLSLPIALDEKIDQLAAYMRASFYNAFADINNASAPQSHRNPAQWTQQQLTAKQDELVKVFSEAVALLKLHDDTYRHNESGLTIPQVADKLKTMLDQSDACKSVLTSNLEAINSDMAAAEALRQSSILPVIEHGKNNLTSAQRTEYFDAIDANTSEAPATAEYRNNARSHLTDLGLRPNKVVLHVDLTDTHGMDHNALQTAAGILDDRAIFSNSKDIVFANHLRLNFPAPKNLLQENLALFKDALTKKMTEEALDRHSTGIMKLTSSYLLTEGLYTQFKNPDAAQADSTLSLQTFDDELAKLGIINPDDRKKVLMTALQNCPGIPNLAETTLIEFFLNADLMTSMNTEQFDATVSYKNISTIKATKNDEDGVNLFQQTTRTCCFPEDASKQYPVTTNLVITFDKGKFDQPYISTFTVECDNDLHKKLKTKIANIAIDTKGNYHLTSLTPDEMALLQDPNFLDFILNPNSEQSIAIKACFLADKNRGSILTGNNFAERFNSARTLDRKMVENEIETLNLASAPYVKAIEAALTSYIESARQNKNIDNLRHGGELQTVINAYKTMAQTRPLTAAEKNAFKAILVDFKNQHVRDTSTWFSRNIISRLQKYSERPTVISGWIARLFKATFTRNTANTRLTTQLNTALGANAASDKTTTLSAEASIALASELKKRHISVLDNSNDNYERILTDRIRTKQDVLDDLRQNFTTKLATVNTEVELRELVTHLNTSLQGALNTKLVDLKHAQPLLDHCRKEANLKLFSLPQESRTSPAMADFNTALADGKLFTAMKKLFDLGLSQQDVLSKLVDNVLTKNKPIEADRAIAALLNVEGFKEFVKANNFSDPALSKRFLTNTAISAKVKATILALIQLETLNANDREKIKTGDPQLSGMGNIAFLKAFLENTTVANAETDLRTRARSPAGDVQPRVDPRFGAPPVAAETTQQAITPPQSVPGSPAHASSRTSSVITHSPIFFPVVTTEKDAQANAASRGTLPTPGNTGEAS